MYLTVFVIHIIGVILARLRIYIWDKTSEAIECTEMESKLYRFTGKIDFMTLTSHYPLKIYKMKEKKSGKIRYLMLNDVQRKTCKKGSVYDLYVDKTWNLFLPTKEIPKITKMILYLNVFSSYIFWLSVCLLVDCLVMKRFPATYGVYFHIIASVFILCCLVKYVLFNFVTVNFYWKTKYNLLDEDKVKRKAAKAAKKI